MNRQTFLTKYPCLYHMAHIDSWPGIERHGLLSTSALLDLFEYQREQREAIEARHRAASVTITHSRHGKAVIRDQIPLREEWLVKTLTGTDATGWYRLLNERVFFWATRQRLLKLLKAKSYRNQKHLVLTVDTSRMVDKYGDCIELTHMNTGATFAYPAPRCPNTFKSLEEYTRPDVVEVAVPYGVPDVLSYTVSVDAWQCQTRLREVWSPS